MRALVMGVDRLVELAPEANLLRVVDAGAGETLRALASALGIVGADRPRRSDG